MFVQEYDRPNSAYMLFYERADAPEPMVHATSAAAREEADPGVIPMVAEPSYPVAAADARIAEVMVSGGCEFGFCFTCVERCRLLLHYGFTVADEGIAWQARTWCVCMPVSGGGVGVTLLKGLITS